MDRVDKEFDDAEFIQRLQALYNFTRLLEDAIASVKATVDDLYWENDGIGYFVTYESHLYWFGLEYEHPHRLEFQTAENINIEAAERLAQGYIEDDVWFYRLDLAVEENQDHDFFALEAAEQLKLIENFLIESLDIAKTLQL